MLQTPLLSRDRRGHVINDFTPLGNPSWQSSELETGSLSARRFASLNCPNTSGLDEEVSDRKHAAIEYRLLGKRLAPCFTKNRYTCHLYANSYREAYCGNFHPYRGIRIDTLDSFLHEPTCTYSLPRYASQIRLTATISCKLL